MARLPVYLHVLTEQVEQELTKISSEGLADLAGVNAAKVRKDLSYLGSYGTRGVGYDIRYLKHQIRRQLGIDHDWPVLIVGAGNLGHALAGYGGFEDRGFCVAAIVDVDEAKVGTRVGEVLVHPLTELDQLVRWHSIAIAVIATPTSAAQAVADRVVDAGVTSILNFAPTTLSVPENIRIRKVDLAMELQILSYHEQQRVHDPGENPAAGEVTRQGSA